MITEKYLSWVRIKIIEVSYDTLLVVSDKTIQAQSKLI